MTSFLYSVYTIYIVILIFVCLFMARARVNKDNATLGFAGASKKLSWENKDAERNNHLHAISPKKLFSCKET